MNLVFGIWWGGGLSSGSIIGTVAGLETVSGNVYGFMMSSLVCRVDELFYMFV